MWSLSQPNTVLFTSPQRACRSRFSGAPELFDDVHRRRGTIYAPPPSGIAFQMQGFLVPEVTHVFEERQISTIFLSLFLSDSMSMRRNSSCAARRCSQCPLQRFIHNILSHPSGIATSRARFIRDAAYIILIGKKRGKTGKSEKISCIVRLPCARDARQASQSPLRTRQTLSGNRLDARRGMYEIFKRLARDVGQVHLHRGEPYGLSASSGDACMRVRGGLMMMPRTYRTP